MKAYIVFACVCFSALLFSCSYEQPEYNPIRKGDLINSQPEAPEEVEPVVPDIYPERDYDLVWSEEFEGSEDFEDDDDYLDSRWNSENNSNTHILSGRYRENVVISDGTVKLVNKKETRSDHRGSNDWTSASIWTKEKFKYGYFECRYKYARAGATNNSFWLITNTGVKPEQGDNFELDINEGHYPNEVNTTIHQIKWQGERIKTGKSLFLGMEPGYSLQREFAIKTNKIRFSSNHATHFHIREFRILSVAKSYPEPLSDEWETEVVGITNYAESATVTSGGNYNNSNPANVCDGKQSTSWIAPDDGEKWLEFDLGEEKIIGCIQFINGWQDKENWTDLITDYKIQYEVDGQWIDYASMDVTESVNLADEYHTYGLDWTEDELIFYFDRKEIRREKNTFCFTEAPIYLSLAIIEWGGPIVEEELDGSQMEVDYVRVYRRK